MLYGRVLRPPSYKATLESIDLSEAKAMKDVVVVQDGEFVGFAAPSLFLATQALEAAAKTASWKTVPQPSSKTIHAYLKEHARMGGCGRIVRREGLCRRGQDAQRDVHPGLHPAHADGAAGGRRRVEGR